MSYSDFIATKSQFSCGSGFEPSWLPDQMFDFQKALADWAVRLGRAAIFADCGLGKSYVQLVWAENVVRKTNRPVLVLTPLAVSHQTCREADKFGIEAERSPLGKFSKKIVVTNYERLHHFDPAHFDGIVCDESSILKNFGGKTRQAITEFARKMPYRLLCTATAAPNDYVELGTSSEALGYLGHTDMITRFFKEETIKDYLGWGRKTYKFRGHAEQPFWQWVCSWARACRKPSDLGFDDAGMILPELIEQQRLVNDSMPRDGFLFSVPARDLPEQREERRITLKERCDLAAELAASHPESSVIWCHLNDEGDLLEKLVPEAKQVSGSMDDDQKEERLLAFQSGQIKRLVTKPKIGCFGLNWQHCHNVITFPSHSFEQYYQAVRRCWRFGQKHPVTVTIVSTEGEQSVLNSIRRKSQQADAMFSSLVKHMAGAMGVDEGWKFSRKERVPSWL